MHTVRVLLLIDLVSQWLKCWWNSDVTVVGLLPDNRHIPRVACVASILNRWICNGGRCYCARCSVDPNSLCVGTTTLFHGNTFLLHGEADPLVRHMAALFYGGTSTLFRSATALPHVRRRTVVALRRQPRGTHCGEIGIQCFQPRSPIRILHVG